MHIKHKFLIQSVNNANAIVPSGSIIYADTLERAEDIAKRGTLQAGNLSTDNAYVIYQAIKVIGFKTPPIKEFEIDEELQDI